MKTAVVVGALGVIGRYIVERLAALPDWRVVGLSRRRGEDRERVRYISVDLLDPADDRRASCRTSRTRRTSSTAPSSAAAGAAADYAQEHRRQPRHAGERGHRRRRGRARPRARGAGDRNQVLRLAPGAVPHPGASEDDPRHLGPNYYFDQIDWLTEFQRGRRWSWSELRPQTLCGFAPGTAMSIVPVIAVYAAISQGSSGCRCAFPASPGAWRSVYQVTESAHMANAALWAATEPRCANQAYNITNGDTFRWCNLWPRIARGVRHALGRAADDLARGAHGRQGAAMGSDGRASTACSRSASTSWWPGRSATTCSAATGT